MPSETSLRNLAISLLRMADATNIAKALRHCARMKFDVIRCAVFEFDETVRVLRFRLWRHYKDVRESAFFSRVRC